MVGLDASEEGRARGGCYTRLLPRLLLMLDPQLLLPLLLQLLYGCHAL